LRFSGFIILGVAVLIECYDTFWGDGTTFRYQRSWLGDAEFWRIVTAHFDHLGWLHLFLNAAFLVILLACFSALFLGWRLIVLFLLNAVLISVLFYLLCPSLVWYVGMSGVLYSLLVYALILDASFPVWLRLGVLMCVLVKVAYEQFFLAEQGWSASLIGGPVAHVAHWYGVWSGFVFAAMVKVVQRWK